MDFEIVFQKFSDQFPPAEQNEATLRLTMYDLVKVFQNFFPADIDNNLLYEMMIKAGYHYAPVNRSGTINFFWFLKEVKSGVN